MAAILLKGSYARDEPAPFSDIDFDVLVNPGPRDDYLAFLVEVGAGHLVHVSVAVQSVEAWVSEADEPQEWAFWLPAHETTRLLWAQDADLRHLLDRPGRLHRAGPPELEDFVEAWGKVRNALGRNDDLAVRLAAQTLAQLCPSLLGPLNPKVAPSHRTDALRAALQFPIAPDGYRDDLLRCLGLTGHAGSMQEIHDAARRLTLGTLALLREHEHLVKGVLPSDLHGYLRDGTLERYIRQGENGERS